MLSRVHISCENSTAKEQGRTKAIAVLLSCLNIPWATICPALQSRFLLPQNKSELISGALTRRSKILQTDSAVFLLKMVKAEIYAGSTVSSHYASRFDCSYTSNLATYFQRVNPQDK